MTNPESIDRLRRDVVARSGNSFIEADMADVLALFAAYDDACRERDLLRACVKDLLPFATRDVQRLNETMVGSLYPAINLAMLERAHEALKGV